MTRIRGRKRLDLIEEFAIVAQYHTVPFARRDRKGFFLFRVRKGFRETHKKRSEGQRGAAGGQWMRRTGFKPVTVVTHSPDLARRSGIALLWFASRFLSPSPVSQPLAAS